MTRGTFSAQIKRFADRTTAQAEAVMKESIQDVMDIAQTPKAKGGRMPVDTGFLRNSLASGLNGSFGAKGPDSYTLVIAGMELGDVARFAWTAEYAIPQELGTSTMPGNHFVGAAAAQWQSIVDANAARLKP